MAATGSSCLLLPTAKLVANAGLSSAAQHRSSQADLASTGPSCSRFVGQKLPAAARSGQYAYVYCRQNCLQTARQPQHASSGAHVTCLAQRDNKRRGWWLGRQPFPRADERRTENERPPWVPKWVPDSPPEWLETSLKQLPGDCVFVEIGTYRFLRRPARGDIVVFRSPSVTSFAAMGEEGDLGEAGAPGSVMSDAAQALDAQYVKRVVAVGGDLVQVDEGTVLVNKQPRSEEATGGSPAAYSVPAVRVPYGSLFVLGDNRNRSVDSHVWGFLPEERVVGRSWLRWRPFSRIGTLR